MNLLSKILLCQISIWGKPWCPVRTACPRMDTVRALVSPQSLADVREAGVLFHGLILPFLSLPSIQSFAGLYSVLGPVLGAKGPESLFPPADWCQWTIMIVTIIRR